MAAPDHVLTSIPSDALRAAARCEHPSARLRWPCLRFTARPGQAGALRARGLLRRALGLALAAGLALTPASAAPSAPAGPVERVSLDNGADQLRPAAALDAQGNAVVVWQGFNAASASYDIFARRYAADGAPRGEPFVVNQSTALKQSRPAVALDADGDFVVAWDGAGAGGDSQEIWARRFAADGSPRSGDMLVNKSTAGSQFDPAVALDADGNFVVAWQGAVAGDPAGVALRRFSSAGVAISASDLVPYGSAAAAAGEQSNPSVALDADGDFAVAWESYSYDDDTGTIGYEIALQPYSAAGVAQGAPQILAAASGSAAVRAPSLATLPDGTLVTAWEYSRGTAGDAQIELRIQGRPAAADPSVSTPGALRVSPGAAARRYSPSLAIDAAGTIVVNWGDATTRSGGELVGLAARAVTGAAQLDGDEFYPALPGAAGTGTSVISAAAATGSPGVWLVAWDSEPPGALPTAGVYMRRYLAPAALVSAASPLQVAEGGADAGLSVALRTSPGADVTLTLTPQSDQIALGDAAPGQPLQLTFTPANATTPQPVRVRAADDDLPEGPQQTSIGLALASADAIYAGAPLLINGAAGASLSVTIADNDTVQYTIAASAAQLPEGDGVTGVTLTVSRAGATGGGGSVAVALGGSARLGGDYRLAGGSAALTSASGTVSFAPGEASKTIMLEVLGNTSADGDRTITATLSGPTPAGLSSIAAGSASVRIVDDDGGAPQIRLHLPLLRR